MSNLDLSLRKKVPLKKKVKITGKHRRKFRALYGRKPVNRAISILKEKKIKHNCPLCSYPKKVKRSGTATFKCTKCLVEFASSSYSFLK